MPENSSKNSLPWSESHDAYCYQHHIPPAAKTLWQWLMRQGEIGAEIEPDLSEFNAWDEIETAPQQTHSVGGQIRESDFQYKSVGEQVPFDTLKVAPQHDTHWVERYWVQRSGNKYWYFRYCLDDRQEN